MLKSFPRQYHGVLKLLGSGVRFTILESQIDLSTLASYHVTIILILFSPGKPSVFPSSSQKSQLHRI